MIYILISQVVLKLVCYNSKCHNSRGDYVHITGKQFYIPAIAIANWKIESSLEFRNFIQRSFVLNYNNQFSG